MRDHEFRESILRLDQPVRSENLRKELKETGKGFNRQNQEMTLKPVEIFGFVNVTSFIVFVC